MLLALPFRISSLLAITLSAVAFGLAVPEMLGAHPWWARQVVMMGAPVGIVLGAILWTLRAPMWLRLPLGLLVLGAGVYVAKYGQTAFVASYAEDALAGKLWYFGWIAASLGLPLAIMGLAQTKGSEKLPESSL